MQSASACAAATVAAARAVAVAAAITAAAYVTAGSWPAAMAMAAVWAPQGLAVRTEEELGALAFEVFVRTPPRKHAPSLAARSSSARI